MEGSHNGCVCVVMFLDEENLAGAEISDFTTFISVCVVSVTKMRAGLTVKLR